MTTEGQVRSRQTAAQLLGFTITRHDYRDVPGRDKLWPDFIYILEGEHRARPASMQEYDMFVVIERLLALH